MRSRFLLLFCVTAFPLARAHADPLPAAEYTVNFEQQTVGTGPGSFSRGGDLGELAGLPGPVAHTHVDGQGTSFAQLIYWFRVEGPAADATVPIEIAGKVQISAGGAVFRKNMVWGLTAQLIGQSFTGPLGPGVDQFDYQLGTVDCRPINGIGSEIVGPPIPTCASAFQSANVVLKLNTKTDADNRIVLNAATNNQEAIAANFDARVDPVISFAPGFDSTGYRIVFSDGIGNAPAPEPAAALLIGATAAGLMRRRRS